jgi:hypothetical protein
LRVGSLYIPIVSVESSSDLEKKRSTFFMTVLMIRDRRSGLQHVSLDLHGDPSVQRIRRLGILTGPA